MCFGERGCLSKKPMLPVSRADKILTKILFFAAAVFTIRDLKIVSTKQEHPRQTCISLF